MSRASSNFGRAERWIVLIAALVLALALSAFAGRGGGFSLPAHFFELRMHRGLVACLAGAGLSLAGVIMQGLFRNPLASPSVLGTTSGAAFGGELALVVLYVGLGNRVPSGWSGELLLPLGCVLGAVASLAIVLALSPLRASALSLLLTGFLFSALFASLSALLKSLVQETWQLTRMLSLLSLGSVSGAGPKQLALAGVLVLGASVPACLYWRELDLLMSGEEEAASLGVDVARVRFWCVVWAALLTAGAVAVGASVPFVGLIVPHALRRVFGEGHRALMPAALLGGGVFLLACDVLCRLLPLPNEVPLSVVTALIGVPLFVRMLARLEREVPA